MKRNKLNSEYYKLIYAILKMTEEIAVSENPRVVIELPAIMIATFALKAYAGCRDKHSKEKCTEDIFTLLNSIFSDVINSIRNLVNEADVFDKIDSEDKLEEFNVRVIALGAKHGIMIMVPVRAGEDGGGDSRPDNVLSL